MLAKFYPLLLPCLNPKGHGQNIDTNMNALVLMVMHSMFGHDWLGGLFPQFVKIQPNFTLFDPLWAPRGPTPSIGTNMKGLVLRVMHTKFDSNWPTTFRDVENVKSL